MIWHVLFHPSEGEWWAGKYRHVSLLGYADQTWLYLDLSRAGVEVTPFYSYDEVQAFLEVSLATYTVVQFGRAKKRSHFLRPMTCVSFVKHTLGIGGGALRPDALLRTLVRDYSARVLNDPQSPEADTGTGSAGATSGG